MFKIRSLILSAAAALLLAGCAANLVATADGTGIPRAGSGTASRPAKIAFAPLSGPPLPVAQNLAGSFARAAVARDLVLAPYRNRRSALVMKGFVSILAGPDGTTVVYVWDVMGPDLQRLHRISGQITDSMTAPDPWEALQPQTLDAIADATLQQLALWMDSR